ncbi:MAG: MoxR family ATPase [Candidatus Aenigmarchaeota archaeon]|nr:MoxR family ATPase [Candidatus Aenigmarchaeota archaeon]
MRKDLKKYSEMILQVKREIQKCVYGQEDVISSIIKALICNGHCLLEGVPGVAKTLSIMALSRTIKDIKYQRIQFTPDLLPSDITGTVMYIKGKGFQVSKGPIFGNIIAADEINRAPSKVQSAMLQAMQEREVTIGKETFQLPKPFMVLATQNPLETKGVYPLPEAQVDRFLFKLKVGYPERENEMKIIDENAEIKRLDDYGIKKVMTKKDIIEIQKLVKTLKSSTGIKKYIVRLVNATRHPDRYNIKLGKYIKWGASPRATIYLNLSGKATALMNGRDYVIPDDIREVAPNVLRHRIILNYEGKAEGIGTDEIIEEIIDKVPIT